MIRDEDAQAAALGWIALLCLVFTAILILSGCAELQRAQRALPVAADAIARAEPFVLACAESAMLSCPEGEAGRACVERWQRDLDTVAEAFQAVRDLWCEFIPCKDPEK